MKYGIVLAITIGLGGPLRAQTFSSYYYYVQDNGRRTYQQSVGGGIGFATANAIGAAAGGSSFKGGGGSTNVSFIPFDAGSEHIWYAETGATAGGGDRGVIASDTLPAGTEVSVTIRVSGGGSPFAMADPGAFASAGAAGELEVVNEATGFDESSVFNIVTDGTGTWSTPIHSIVVACKVGEHLRFQWGASARTVVQSADWKLSATASCSAVAVVFINLVPHGFSAANGSAYFMAESGTVYPAFRQLEHSLPRG